MCQWLGLHNSSDLDLLFSSQSLPSLASRTSRLYSLSLGCFTSILWTLRPFCPYLVDQSELPSTNSGLDSKGHPRIPRIVKLRRIILVKRIVVLVLMGVVYLLLLHPMLSWKVPFFVLSSNYSNSAYLGNASKTNSLYSNGGSTLHFGTTEIAAATTTPAVVFVPTQMDVPFQPDDLDLRNLGDLGDVQMAQPIIPLSIPRPTSAISEAFSEDSNLGHATARMSLLDGEALHTATGARLSNPVAMPQPAVPVLSSPAMVRSDSFGSDVSA